MTAVTRPDIFVDVVGHDRTRSAAMKMEADLDATCLEKGWTALMYAAHRGCVATVKSLLEAGSRVYQLSNPTGKEGRKEGRGHVYGGGDVVSFLFVFCFVSVCRFIRDVFFFFKFGCFCGQGW